MVVRPPAVWAAREHRRILRELWARALGSPNESLRAYLGSPLPVLGVRTAEFRRVVHTAIPRLATQPVAARRALVRSLWRGSTLEEKAAAIELLGRPPLVTDALAWQIGDSWIDTATGWALSDSLASGPMATLAAGQPDRFDELLRWTKSKNLWRRRASTYALRVWVRAGELDRPFLLLFRLLDDPERWVQRAVGT